MCKENVGFLLKSIRSIESTQITQREDFGKGCHTMASEPYFYDSSYQYVKRNSPIPINEDSQCLIVNEIYTDKENTPKNGSVPVSVKRGGRFHSYLEGSL